MVVVLHKADHLPIQLYLRDLFCLSRDMNLALRYVLTALRFRKQVFGKNTLKTSSWVVRTFFFNVRTISNGSNPKSYLLWTPGIFKFNPSFSQAATATQTLVHWRKHLLSANYLAKESEDDTDSTLKQPTIQESQNIPVCSEHAHTAKELPAFCPNSWG